MPFRRQHLQANLADRLYWVGEKSDGERRFLFAHQGLAFLIDVRGMRAQPLPPHLAAVLSQVNQPSSSSSAAAGETGADAGYTILDGELVEDLVDTSKKQGEVPGGGGAGSGLTPSRVRRRWLYLVFDAAVLGGHDVGGVEDFKSRLDAARTFLATRGALVVDGNSSSNSGSGDVSSDLTSLAIQVKTFVPAPSLSVLTRMLHPLPAELAEGNVLEEKGKGGSGRNARKSRSSEVEGDSAAAGYLYIEPCGEKGQHSSNNSSYGSSGGGGRRTRSDGLVFVPAARPYYATNCLKWKPPSCTTVDFAVTEKAVAEAMRNGGGNGGGGNGSGNGSRGGGGGGSSAWVPQDVPLAVSAGRQRFEVSTLTLSTRQAAANLLRLCQSAGANVLPQQQVQQQQQQQQHRGGNNSNNGGEAILECAFAGASGGQSAGGWQVLRPRADKRKPNALQTAWRCMEVGG